MGYWIAITAPAVAAPPPVGYSIGRGLSGDPFVNDIGLVESSLGCASGTSAGELTEFFGERRGPLMGWDNPHVIELGPDRWLWLVHDTYLDYGGGAVTLHDGGEQIQNAAFVQEGSCFSMMHRGTPRARLNFETGDGHTTRERFLWPLGGEVDGNRLRVFWAETIPSVPRPAPTEGIIRHPVKTWLAEYDATTLERLSFAPAPNSGVDPIYGFAVSSDETHSYLFGNTNLLNLQRDGGWWNGPHSATRMTLARVARGQLGDRPEYWNGDGWSDDPDDAESISERFWIENTMQPRFIDGRWLSVVQEDGFHGRDVLIEIADDPWGPWIEIEKSEYIGRPAAVKKNSYQPILLPWSSQEDGVSIAISENAADWSEAVADPDLYRPAVFRIDWPEYRIASGAVAASNARRDVDADS